MAGIPATETMIEKLNQVRADLLVAVEPIPTAQWRQRPAKGGWSVAEVIAHLTMVETAILDHARKRATQEPQPAPFWKRLHLPLRWAAWRGVKVKSPLPLDPALVGEKDAMLERFRAQRTATLAFLRAHSQRDLRRWHFRHPFFGILNGCERFEVMRYHEIRHTKQICEIVNSH